MAATSTIRTVRRRPTANETERHTKFLGGFDIRHPFDALWGLFSSVRLAIILVSTLIALSVIGMLIIQAPAEVLSSQSDYDAWLAFNAHQQFGDMTDPLNWLQFFTIFRSWYFKVLIVLLAVNILVGGMINRAPAIWQKFRHQQLRRADGFYANSPVKAGVTYAPSNDATLPALTAFLRKRHYNVDVAPESTPATTYLFVHRFTWSALSTFVFHTSLISVMLCAVLTGWSGFGRNSMAEKVLPSPVYHYFQDLAGFSYNQPIPDNTQGVVYPMGTPHNIFYSAKQFVSILDPVRLVATDFYTDLVITQDGKVVAQKRIRVNDPLTYQDVTFHQASFMMYTAMELRDANGAVVFNGSIPLTDHRTAPADPNTGQVLQINNAESVPLSNLGETMNVGAASFNGTWVVGIKGFAATNQQEIFNGATVFGQGCVDSNFKAVAGGQYGCQLSNGWWMNVKEVKRGSVLLVTKDAGSPLLWPVLLLLVLSLWVTFSMPPRRLWIKVEGNQVHMAALKEHFINNQRELDDIARRLGNVPLQEQEISVPTTTTPPAKKAGRQLVSGVQA